MMLVLVTVFFGLQYFRAKTNPQTVSPNATASTPQSSGTQPAAPAAVPAAAASAPAAGVPGSRASAAPTVQASAELTTTVENELYRITFTNRGGQVTSWILKKFKDSEGKPLNLVHTEAAEKFGYPLSLYTYDAALTDSLNKALYVPSATGTLTAPGTLAFTYSDGTDQVRKTFTFDETYVLRADVEARRNGAPIRALISWPGGFGDQDNANAY